MSIMRIILFAAALLWAAPLTAADIADYFRLYCARYGAPSAFRAPLDFLTESPEQILTASAARKVIVDRSNGYLQVSDGSRTDQVLTMAVYRKGDGSQLLVAGTSDCADACIFTVGVYAVSSDRLQATARDAVIPAVEPGRFIKPGQAGPKNVPTVNYVPAHIGTSLTLKPWYGYEVEETMSKATRAALQDVVLTWDRDRGRFR